MRVNCQSQWKVLRDNAFVLLLLEHFPFFLQTSGKQQSSSLSHEAFILLQKTVGDVVGLKVGAEVGVSVEDSADGVLVGLLLGDNV
eukprot:13842263-Ditylum_brightwellii.AAC.1